MQDPQALDRASDGPSRSAGGAAPGFAGLAIGLTLAAIHIVGIQVMGVSVNPARSFGPAVLAGGPALNQLWLFIAAPLLGAAICAAAFRFGLLQVPRPPDTRADRHHGARRGVTPALPRPPLPRP